MENQYLPDGKEIISISLDWFQHQEDVLGIILVGSYARNAAKPDSDIDIVILCNSPEKYRMDLTWPNKLPWERIDSTVVDTKDQDYGIAWSRHVFLSSGLEVEISFVSPSWLITNPLDEGTYQVMSSGHCILYDPQGLIKTFSDYIFQKQN